MADIKGILSRPRFLKGFFGTGFASILLGKSAASANKDNQDETSNNVRLQVRQDPRTISRAG